MVTSGKVTCILDPPLQKNKFLWSWILLSLNTISDRQESESGSEGSGSSQSDSESDDNDNGQPVQMQQRYQVPRLSHFNPAPSMQMSSPPGYPQHSFNNNPTTPTKKNKFDERVGVCVVYS